MAIRGLAFPRSLLEQIGRIATTSAYIEQEIVLQASARAAQKTGGKPIEPLRTDFKRLREKWYSLCKENLDEKTVNKVIHPLNSDLAKMWPVRGYMIHGRWKIYGRAVYTVAWWEQTDTLRHYERKHSLSDIETFANELLKVLGRLYAFADSPAGRDAPVRAS